ncbi:MAG: CHAT domain-containing protein [Geodermatophilaceae bacterium]|nr:CHAT domain-containing protein [Geodermatophilaceae bacterium]
MLTAAQLHQRALVATEHGRPREARRALGLALERCDRPDLKARILLTMGYQAAERGHVDEGLQLLQEAARPGVAAGVMGLIASQRGLLLMRAGRESEALRCFDEALALLHTDDAPAIARAAINRGDVHMQRGDLTRARADFELAVDMAERAQLDVLRAKAMHNLGYVDLLAGDLPQALRRIDEVRPAFEAMSPVHSAVSHGDRARVLVAAGLWTEADHDLAAAAAAFGSRHLRQDQAETELARAQLALAQQDNPKSERLARQAQQRFIRRGSESWALQANLVRLASRAAAGKSLIACHLESLQLAEQLRGRGLTDDSRKAWLVAARALIGAGRYDEARALIRRHPVPANAPITTRLLSYGVRAEVADAAGDRRGTFSAAARGLDELQRWQASFGGLDLQSGLSSHGRQLARRALDLAVASGRPELVYTWVQRARALVSRLPAVSPPRDPEARRLLEELRQLRAGQHDGENPSSRGRQLEEQIRQRSWHNEGPRMVSDEVPLARLQAALSSVDGCMVAHLSSQDALYALLVTSSTVELRPLGSHATAVAALMHRTLADLDAAASDLAPPQLLPVFRASLRASLADLAGALWEPIADRSGGGPLLLVPAGALAALPWTLLPGLAGRPVSVARSISSWFTVRSQLPVARVGLVAGPHVPRATEEVTRAAAAWPAASMLTGEAARTGVVAALAARVDLLHIAAHGKHDEENPLFSSVQLADGLWFGHDIAALPRLPRHVVLSACELGMSTVRWGDETLGMTAAWLHVGASSVISAVADVNDGAACGVLADVHRGLAAGLLPAVALARAMAAQDDDVPVPFVCFGAGW